MAKEYSVDVCKELGTRFQAARLHRPMRIGRYDAGTELVYNVTGVEQANTSRVKLSIEKFVGGGFAGQVYKVKVLDIESSDEPTRLGEAHRSPIAGLEAGKVFAMKILVPPSSFSRLFRNVLYWTGFQGAFSLQVNPAAARAGALWQKFVRRAAKIQFGDESSPYQGRDESAVVDIYATFVDDKLGSCGELSEWIDGRTWRLEVDEHLDMLKRWFRGKSVKQQQVGSPSPSEGLGSPEYLAKRKFMTDFVRLLHDMGAYELARQYEWSTCKSQPNCLKRQGTEDDPFAGLVAVDFRAGLALLPFLPMSPADFKLIAKGIMRGSLVQFDRGDVSKLEGFVKAYSDEFADMREMLQELKTAEQAYRDSLVDITHNHIRLLRSGIWSTIFDSAVTGWKVRNLIDQEHEQKLSNSKALTLLFFVIGIVPLFGSFIRRIWGRTDWRIHYRDMLTNADYFGRSIRARIAEKAIVWHRAGRVNPERALRLQEQLWLFLLHLPLSILPAGLHRFLTDWAFFKDKLHYIFVRPIKLYFSTPLREQWLRDMVSEGKKKHLLTDQDAETILSQLHEPYIQRYLLSLVVHLLTLPITQIVSLILAGIYYRRTGDELGAGGILVLFQVIPISPGSICRGLWAVGIAIYDRSFKDYNIVVFLSFFKYIGYLAFPIQMTYRYPALARFMAAHWATEAVHVVPVFGERGALLEHWVFRLFYNWPLTIRRRMRRRAEVRQPVRPRYWHVGLCALAGASILGIADLIHLGRISELPGLKDIWWLAIVPLLCGAGVTLGCGGAALWKRIIAAAVCGVMLALLYTAVSAIAGQLYEIAVGGMAKYCVWWVFIFAILSTIGAIVAELKLPDPDL